jgi:hypothetical protein
MIWVVRRYLLCQRTTESGFPTLQATFWAGIVAPIGTLANMIDKLKTPAIAGGRGEPRQVQRKIENRLSSGLREFLTCRDGEMDECHNSGRH